MTSDGRTFSGLGTEISKERVTSDVPQGDSLPIASAAEDNAADKQEHEFRLVSPGVAEIYRVDRRCAPSA